MLSRAAEEKYLDAFSLKGDRGFVQKKVRGADAHAVAGVSGRLEICTLEDLSTNNEAATSSPIST